jgi:heme-degrading monooxygenase HmoA
MAPFAATPELPCFAVIFTSRRHPESPSAPDSESSYDRTAQRMVDLASSMPGYLGIESARSPDGFGITVSYWSSEAAIAAWKSQLDHHAAQARGKSEWYEHYELRIAKVVRAYSGPEGR